MPALSEIARKKGINYFMISFLDLFGTMRAKLVPATAIDAVAGVLYVGSDDHHLYALSLRDGSERWRCDLKGRVLGSPAIVRHHVYVGGEGSGGTEPGALFAVDRNDGSVAWRFGVGATVWSSPTVVGDSMWFGAHDGKLRRLSSGRL